LNQFQTLCQIFPFPFHKIGRQAISLPRNYDDGKENMFHAHIHPDFYFWFETRGNGNEEFAVVQKE